MFYKKRIFWIISGLVALSFCLGIFVTRAQQSGNSVFESLSLFSQVLHLVQTQYVEEVNPQKLIYGAIKGMLASLDDPHTHFMEPQGYSDLQVETRGEFGGLGIEISIAPVTKQLMVIAPMEGTPADKAGIKAGDRIIEIEGKSTAGINIQDAVQKLRGQKGTPVTITIERDGVEEPIKITIVRDIIQLKAVKSKCLLSGDIGYLRIVTFNQHVGRELDEAMTSLEKNSMKGLIVDLRNNPGGLLEQAVEVSNKFLSEGLIVSTKGRVQPEIKFYARSGSAHKYVPLIILVNKGSASASEIVAGAVKDNKRGLILGTKTFGKGSVQTVINLEDGSGVALTTAKYYTPSGICIHNIGISPDIEAEEEKEPEDPEAFNVIRTLRQNNCITLYAKENTGVKPEEFRLDDTAMDTFMEIVGRKNADLKRDKLNKYRYLIERDLRIELASQKSKEDGLKMSLSYDPVVRRALDMMKGVQLLTGVMSQDTAARSTRAESQPAHIKQ